MRPQVQHKGTPQREVQLRATEQSLEAEGAALADIGGSCTMHLLAEST